MRLTSASTLLIALSLFPSPVLADDKDDLFEAVRQGNIGKVKALLDKGTDVNTKNEYGATAIIYAVEKGHLDVIKLLIERKADLSTRFVLFRQCPGLGHHE